MSYCSLPILFIAWLLPFEDGAAQWPQFLGPSNLAVSESDVPLTWSPEQNVGWVYSLQGYGQSSPVVWGDTVYVSSVRGAMKETLLVTAVKISTGTKLWEYTMETPRQSENADYFSRAAPTPIVSDAGIVVWFENGDLLALDHAGNLQWHVDLVEQHGPIQSRHGLSASLAGNNDRVAVWVQRDQSPYLLSLHRANGQTAWKRDLEPGTSWSSPTLLPVNATESHLVLSLGGSAGGPNGSTPGKLVGLNPETGETHWELSGLAGNTTPTPTLVAPGRFLVGASAGREGGPSKEAVASNGLVTVQQLEGRWIAEFAWRSTRATCGFCSPIAHAGLAYFVDRRGRMFCLDAATGEELFSENLGHPVWATPLAIGNRVYFVGEEGMTTVIEADRTFKKLAFNELWKSEPPAAQENNARSMQGRTRQYAVVAVPNALFIRRGDQLFCLRPSR